jgi:hypothetical protein
VRPDESLFVPWTSEEQRIIREHLQQILASSAFRNSKRYAAVLRFIMERRLEGGDSQIKERTIGIEVFGRAPDYDTSTDHVVRSAAAEIRKRLAQYYQDEGAHTALRIELHRGSYLPLFRFAAEEERRASPEPLEMAPNAQQAAPTKGLFLRLLKPYWLLAICAALVMTAALPFAIPKPDDPLDRFWAPMLYSPGPMLLCVGTLGSGAKEHNVSSTPDANMSLSRFHGFNFEAVHIGDAQTLARIAGLMDAKRKPYQFASESEATYADLQKGPAVLIGLMNNDWTERLVQNLRFSVDNPSPNVLAIGDHENPAKHDWSVDYSAPYLNVNKDYALIVRAFDPKTGQMVVTLAGLSVFGTIGAGEFVTNRGEMKALNAIAPRDWRHKNMEIVLSVDVIRGVPGHPVIVASRFW